jgi:hypothetical protein
VMVPAGLWTVFANPVVFLILLAVFLVVALVLLHWIVRGVATAAARLRTAARDFF